MPHISIVDSASGTVLISTKAGQTGGENEIISGIEGLAANNNAPAGFPVLMGGVDKTTILRQLSVLPDGTLAVSPQSGKTWVHAQVKLATMNGDTPWIAAPSGGLSVKIRSLVLISDVNQTISIKNTAASGELAGPFYLVANQGFSLPPATCSDEYWVVGTTGLALSIKSTATGNLGGVVSYINEV